MLLLRAPFSISVGWTERSALRALKEQLFVHKSDLMSAFQEFDPNDTGREKSSRRVFQSLIHVYCFLGVREDLFTALGQCHREGAEPGSALEGAAPPAHQQHPGRHGGLPAVDTGILHHRAQTRGKCSTVSTCGRARALIPRLLLQISDNSILETMYRNHCNLETIFRIIDTDHSGSRLRQSPTLLGHVILSFPDLLLACFQGFSRLQWSAEFSVSGC